MGSRTYAYRPETVSAPGRSLKRAIDALGMNQTQFAARLGKSEKFVSEVINGKAPITPETAIHFERVLGTPASFWNESRGILHIANILLDRKRYANWKPRQNGRRGSLPRRWWTMAGWTSQSTRSRRQPLFSTSLG